MRRAISTLAVALGFVCCVPVNSAKSSVGPCDLGEGRRPAIAADEKGHVFVVFGNQEKDRPISEIFFRTSPDGGKTWSAPIDISNTPGDSGSPDIAVEKSGAIDVVWTDATSGSEFPDIFFVRSTDGGKSWTTPKDISNTPDGSYEPAIAVGSNDKLHVVWCDTNKGDSNKDVFYTWSSDGGEKWGKDELQPAVDISNTPGISSEPAIAVSADNLPHVAWIDTTTDANTPDVFYTTATSAAPGTATGEIWSKPLNVSRSAKQSAHPDIACGPKNKVYLSWSDNSKGEHAADIWCALSSSPGKFEKPINISNNSGVSSEPANAADGSYLAVVWTDNTKSEKTPDIWGRISIDNGKVFTEAVDLGNTPGISKSPDVAIGGNMLYIVWQEVQGLSNTLKFESGEVKDMATGHP